MSLEHTGQHHVFGHYGEFKRVNRHLLKLILIEFCCGVERFLLLFLFLRLPVRFLLFPFLEIWNRSVVFLAISLCDLQCPISAAQREMYAQLQAKVFFFYSLWFFFFFCFLFSPLCCRLFLPELLCVLSLIIVFDGYVSCASRQCFGHDVVVS